MTRNLIIAIIVALSFNSCISNKPYIKEVISKDRTNIVFKTSKIEVDNKALMYTEEFILEAIKYGYDIEEASKLFLGIYIDVTPGRTWGVTMRNTDGTFFSLINDSVTSENKLRVIIFHELGHYFIWGEAHCHVLCDHIMSSSGGSHNFYRDWEKQKIQFFKSKL